MDTDTKQHYRNPANRNKPEKEHMEHILLWVTADSAIIDHSTSVTLYYMYYFTELILNKLFHHA